MMGVSGWLLALATLGGTDDPAGAEFFEKEVRPLLVSRCQSCHGSEKQKGELRLDSRAAALLGGGNGPAVVPGKAGESPLVEAINYGDLAQMPPKSKLSAEEIATLTKWVEIGAPWPDSAPSSEAATKAGGAFDLAARSKFWSFQPVRRVEAPAVTQADWPRTDVDRFLLAALEAKGLAPAPDADRRTLIRRATFDLTGLPPSPEDVEAFVKDSSPEAFAGVVERLLASPAYGERWGRHWLDLVRYAETSGHEFDYDIPGAFRYRDYVIRAFNADVPFDAFVTEHVAGDLLPNPRRDPSTGRNESICATGFFALGDGTHSPVDVRVEEMRRVENQIDTLSKAFLGLTVACARCHDHKFDPISTQDYYGLAGYFRSSRFQLADLGDPAISDARVAELASAKAAIRPNDVAEIPGQLAAYLAGVREVADAPGKPSASVAAARGLDEATLNRWVAALAEPAVADPSHGLAAWATGSRGVPEGSHSEVLADFNGPDFAGWTATGRAFGDGPTKGGVFRVAGDRAVVVPAGQAQSGVTSNRLAGVLRSPAFTIRPGFLLYRASGRKGRIRLVVDGFQKIRDPIYGRLSFVVEAGDDPKWFAQDVGMWAGQRAYIELADGETADYSAGGPEVLATDGFLAVDEIRFSDQPLPAPPSEFAEGVRARGVDLDGSAKAFAERLTDAARRWREGTLGADDRDRGSAEALAFLGARGLIPTTALPAEGLARYRTAESALPGPVLAPALVDGSAEDENVHVRGNAKTLGDLVPRRFLEALGGLNVSPPSVGSGRLDLARQMVDPADPLVARVLVNRVWKHHFVEGLVRSPDDFGVMGQAPSHPELLDYLAARFVAEGWSIKQLHRLLMGSRAYAMASVADPSAEVADPGNRLLHRMNVRRLEAEAVRDAILAASGRLDAKRFGPSVPPYLTPFMDGRGRPAGSGPLDGDGRRSLYLGVRRNFLNPMLLAFDYPAPATAVGRRNVSNVPAQSLALWNDPFVLAEARRWAERVASRTSETPEARVEGLFRTAFGRRPTDDERAKALAFLHEQAPATNDPAGWADLCQVLFNCKEFLYVE